MHFGEALRFSFQALRANPVRSFLTCLGMMIGNASVILVVTISQTSQDYILEQIRGLGSNMIYAFYETGSHSETKSAADFIKQADVNEIRTELGRRIVAVTAVMNNTDSILIDGKQRDVKVIGSDQYYKNVRNLVVPAGRFLDAGDI
jgi:putative ABC transport system permease protein